MLRFTRLLLFGLIGLILVACQPAAVAPLQSAALPSLLPTRPAQSRATALPPASPTPWPTPTSTPSPSPTAAPTATPTVTPTPTATPTPTPPPICQDRRPSDDELLPLVSRDYGLSRDYEPGDLVPLSSYFPPAVTLGYPNDVRAIIIEPLKQLIADMQAAGLHPTIISGYRSYASQAIAWDKWNTRYPDYGHWLSAPPGHSEHQLGTTLDFGSPELDNEFHTNFYLTNEGEWLLANAQRYGFTLSYPREKFEVTQFYYEPWHYRYVGVELATQLKAQNLTLTEYLLAQEPTPCQAKP